MSEPKTKIHYASLNFNFYFFVRSTKDDLPIHIKTQKEIQAALKNTIPVLSETTTTFAQLKDKIYYRLTHKEEVQIFI